MAYNTNKGREYHLIALDRNGNFLKKDGRYVYTKVEYKRYMLYIDNVQAAYTNAKTRKELEDAFKLTFRLENPEKQWFRDAITGKASRLGMDKATDYEQELALQEPCFNCKVLFPPMHLDTDRLCPKCAVEVEDKLNEENAIAYDKAREEEEDYAKEERYLKQIGYNPDIAP